MGIIKSAGLVIVCGDEILLCHPTNASWAGTYSISKGEMQDFESALDTAIRETKEEIGLDFTEYFDDHSGIMDGIIDYRKKNSNKKYKSVFYFIVKLDEKLKIDKKKLQKEEVDWAGFMNKKEAEKKIFWRFKPILEKIFDHES